MIVDSDEVSPSKMQRKIVLVNQLAGYLFVDIANAFIEEFDEVVLMTGKYVPMEDPLSSRVIVQKIYPYNRSSGLSRVISWIVGLVNIYLLLLTRYRGHKLLISSNPPLASTLLPLLLWRKIGLLIYDIYPDGLVATGFLSKRNLIYRVWAFLNRKSFRKVDWLVTLNDGMAAALTNYVSAEKISVVPVWSSFPVAREPIVRQFNKFLEVTELRDKWIVMYSGNFGKGYHLKPLIQLAEMFTDNSDVAFVLAGKGWQKDHLAKEIKSRNLKNCHLLPPQSAELFVHSLYGCHVGVVSLPQSLEKVAIPSKTFNILAAGKPVFCIGSTSSELSRFLTGHGIGFACEPLDLDLMKQHIQRMFGDEKYYQGLCNNALKIAENHSKDRAKDILAKFSVGHGNSSRS